MGDNIRLKGPLGLKQDIYDQARSEEWRKIIKLDDTKEIIKKLEEQIDKPKKEKNGNFIISNEKRAIPREEIRKFNEQKEKAKPKTFKEFKQKIKDYSEFKKSNKKYDEEMDQYFQEQDKLKEKDDYKRFLDEKYGVEVKSGGFIDMTKDKKYFKGRL